MGRRYQLEISVSGIVKGVITGIPSDISMEEVTENIRGGKVINARRLFKNKEGQRLESIFILLTFEGSLPEKSSNGIYIRYPV